MNIGDLFDSPWKILIVAIVIIVLFGSAKLPVAARSLGRSMRILKSEVTSMREDDEDEVGSQPVAAAPAQLAASAPQRTVDEVAADATHQARIDHLEQQLRDLKDSADKKAAVSADQQPR